MDHTQGARAAVVGSAERECALQADGAIGGDAHERMAASVYSQHVEGDGGARCAVQLAQRRNQDRLGLDRVQHNRGLPGEFPGRGGNKNTRER